MAPFSAYARRHHGPHGRPGHGGRRDREDRAQGRHGHSRFARGRRPDRSPSLEGRHAIILLTDGYDEHSTQAFDDALTAVQRTGAAVYVVGIGGVAGISLKGERFLQEAGQRHRRPGIFPDARDRAQAHPRAGGQRGDAALHPHLRAEEPEGGRDVAQDRRGGQRPDAARARQTWVLCAEACGSAAVDRVHPEGPDARTRGRDHRRPRGRRRRRVAAARGVPGGGDAGLDRVRARRQRQHEKGDRGREGRRQDLRAERPPGGRPRADPFRQQVACSRTT